MTGERWPRVKALFEAAVERPAEERDAFLAAATGDDAALRREVESLLRSDSADLSFFDRLPVASESVLGDPLAALPASMEPGLSHSALASGLRVGPYEIVAPLGAGAMGEVYRARDTKLNRIVALKVLPERFALDPDRSARFTREAQLLATLNHPNIAAIYGLEESKPPTGSGHGAVQALVLELVDGPTLADRIALGPVPVAEALTIARQIAEGLEAAHEKAIIHRDLKPANIKVASSGAVKVLDFGLARVWDGAPQPDLSRSPTLTATAPGAGIVLGTPAYMSPEQARGQSLDRRTDIWSFGCVLYEMLTGRVPFGGNTISDTLAAILDREADFTRLPANTPVPIRRLLRRCLEKDRKKRLDSASDARLEIEDAISLPAETPAPMAPASRRLTAKAIAALASISLAAALAVWILMRPGPPAPVLTSRFAIVTPQAWPLNTRSRDRDLAVSPDGRYLVYRIGTSNVGDGLMLRAIDQLEGRRLAGITDAFGAPFFSPDSQWIGFFENRALKKVSIAGGPVIPIGPVTGEARGASWGPGNTIVFATDDPSTGLWRVSADGGEPTVLTRPDAKRQETDHLFPSVLPDGRGVVFTIAAAGQAGSTQLAVLDLASGQWKTIVSSGTQAEYVGPSTRARQGFSTGTGRGHLVYAAAGSLRAIEFDPARLDVHGDPATVVETLSVKPTGAANYAVSLSGTLVHVPVGGQGGLDQADGATRRSLVWVDRRGREEPFTNAPLDFYNVVNISPDGTRVAVKIGPDIWIRDLAPAMWRKLTFDPRDDSMPLWTPDGRRIIFGSDRGGAVLNLYSQAADGTGKAERLTTTENAQWSTAVTRDGTIIGLQASPKGAESVFQLRLANPASRAGRESWTPLDGAVAEALIENAYWPDISRDGRYLAYQAQGESGRSEIYVCPFPNVNGGRWQVSTGGGTRVMWALNGRELFYLDASNKLTVVPVRTSGATFMITGSPARVSETSYVSPHPARHYDESPDGRLLVIKTAIDSDPTVTPASMVVVLNGFEELKQRVNVK